MGLLAASVSPALAATATDGNGAFNAAAHINLPPPPFGEPCATYSLYNVQLAFSDNSTFTASSDPNPLSSDFQWGEFGDGTHHPQGSATDPTSCGDAPGQLEAGFTGTLTRPGGLVCTLSEGSYKRTDLAVEYDFESAQRVAGTGTCPSASPTVPLAVKANIRVLQHFDPPLVIPPGIEIYDLTACSSVIAPTTCVLEKGTYPY